MRDMLFCSLILLLALYLPASSQNWRATPFEFYAGAGSANYFGDIGGTADDDNWYGLKDLDFIRSRPTLIAGLRYIPGRYFAYSGSLALGWLSGDDEGSRNEHRQFVFNTIILEPSARIEFMPIKDLQVLRGVDRRGLVRNYGTLTTYVFAGLGAVIYHVIPNERLEYIQNHPNWDISYWPVTMVIPAGLGVKIGISNTTDIGLEIGGRYALNDYIDGYTSEFSTANDIYYLTTVKLVYRLPYLWL